MARSDGERGPEYILTASGRELAGLVGALGTWGQRWLPRHAEDEDLDLEPALVDMRGRGRAPFRTGSSATTSPMMCDSGNLLTGRR